MIDKNQVKCIANLARLGITEEENGKFQKEISAILDYFKALEKVDTSKVAPTFHSTEEFIKKEETTRKDKAVPREESLKKMILEAAPDREEKYVKVKAVLQS